LDDSRIKAYTYLFYCAMLDIRSASNTHWIRWWNPKTWVHAKKNMDEINNIADTLHNLPDLIVNRPEKFDETWFWDHLSKRLPEKYEFYHKVFSEKLHEQYK